MKKILKIFPIILVSSLSACIFGFNRVTPIDDFYSNEVSNRFKNLGGDLYTSKINEYYESVSDLIKKNDSSDTTSFLFQMSYFTRYLLRLRDSVNVRLVHFYAADGKYNEDDYNEAIEYFNRALKYRSELLNGIYHSVFKESVFVDMTDEEIEELLSGINKDVSGADAALEITKISNEAEKIYNEYYGDSTYPNRMYDLLVRFKNATNEYCTATNTESYLDYAYETTYSRDYLASDLTEYYAAVKNYISPVYSSLSLPNLSIEENTYFTKLSRINFRCKETNVLSNVTSYIDSVGGDLAKSFNHIWNGGYYCFSNSTKSLGTAFTDMLMYYDEPILYFSRDYQSAFTFIHEFGHYSHFLLTDNYNGPYDIFEVDSKGNEALFSSYIEQFGDYGGHEQAYKALTTYSMMQLVSSALSGAMVSEIEQYFMTNDISNKNEFMSHVNDIISSYNLGSNATNYWWAPAIANFGYYISYSTSSIGALQFYVNSHGDYEATAKQYLDFVERSGEETSISKICENAKLLPINTKEAVKLVGEYFLNGK